MKLSVLGGSSIHTPALAVALCAQKVDRFTDLVLHGTDSARLSAVEQVCRDIISRAGKRMRVSSTPDAARAIDGAHVILNQMRPGGWRGKRIDRLGLAASGIVGHAASYSETLRILPVLERMLPHLARHSSDTLFVDFSNPVSAICEYVASATDLTIAGLCYHASVTRADFAAILGVSQSSLHLEMEGINHLSFITDASVGGEGRFHQLKEELIRRRSKLYNFDTIATIGAIPISNAYSLLFKKEVWFVRQLGVRRNAIDILFRLTRVDLSWLQEEASERAAIMRRIAAQDQGVVRTIVRRSPWYEKTIVPFLSDYFGDIPTEHTVTSRVAASANGLSGGTAEGSSLVGRKTIVPMPIHTPVSAHVRLLLQAAILSELQFLEALRRRSAHAAVEALIKHPNVASRRHAERFLRHYPDILGSI